jgi:hypothetical protein
MLLSLRQLVRTIILYSREATPCGATSASISVTAEGSLRALTSETLLRLLLPLNDQVWTTFRPWVGVATLPRPVRKPHLAIQSVVATGGVYKRQGRNQRKLMTCAY